MLSVLLLSRLMILLLSLIVSKRLLCDMNLIQKTWLVNFNAGKI